MSRIGKSIETENRFTVARVRGGGCRIVPEPNTAIEGCTFIIRQIFIAIFHDPGSSKDWEATVSKTKVSFLHELISQW